MKYTVIVSLVMLLALIFFQDLRSRSIHLLVLLMYLVLAVLFNIAVKPFMPWHVALNWLYVAVLLGMAALIVSMLRKMDIRKVLGAGDVLFLFVTALYFDFPGFVVWLNVAFVSSFVLHLLASALSPAYREKKLIPLAGFLAVIFAPAIVFEIYVRPVSSFIYQP